MPYQQGNKRIHTEAAKTSKTPALRVHVPRPTYMFYKSTTTMYTANVQMNSDTGKLYSFCGELKCNNKTLIGPDIFSGNREFTFIF